MNGDCLKHGRHLDSIEECPECVEEAVSALADLERLERRVFEEAGKDVARLREELR